MAYASATRPRLSARSIAGMMASDDADGSRNWTAAMTLETIGVAQVSPAYCVCVWACIHVGIYTGKTIGAGE